MYFQKCRESDSLSLSTRQLGLRNKYRWWCWLALEGKMLYPQPKKDLISAERLKETEKEDR